MNAVVAVTRDASTSSAARSIASRVRQALHRLRVVGGGDARRPAHPQRLARTVRLWLLNGTLENTIWPHKSGVTALAALSDNQHALSGSTDKTVKLFNVSDGAVLRTFKHHTAEVWCLALMPDGLRFVSHGRGTARIVEHGLRRKA